MVTSIPFPSTATPSANPRPVQRLILAAACVGLLAPLGISQISASQGPGSPAAVQRDLLKRRMCRTKVEVEGNVCADNFYTLYSGDYEGDCMTLTEIGSGCSWSTPDYYNLTTTDHFFYIACWSDDGVAQGLLHDLTFNGEPAFSGSPSWSVYPTGIDRDTCGGKPSAALIKNEIVTASWQPAVTDGPLNQVPDISPYPWGPIAPTSSQARWTWYDSGGSTHTLAPFRNGYDHGEVLIFRIAVHVVAVRATADNYMKAYTSDSQDPGMRLTLRGSNCNWATSTSFVFTTTDPYFYFAGWSDDASAQGLLFDVFVDGEHYTGPETAWGVYPTMTDMDSCAGPTDAQMEAGIQAAVGNYVAPTVGGPNDGSFFWPSISPITTGARWIWYDSGNCGAGSQPFFFGCEHDEYLVFRLELPTGCRCGSDPLPAGDCNENGILDSFELSPNTDCDHNGVLDECELAGHDCNGNGILDACEIAMGLATDVNGNGVPDECECQVTNYCEAVPNSTGAAGALSSTGSCSVSANDLVLRAHNLPPGQPAHFLYASGQAALPFGDGVLCLSQDYLELGAGTVDAAGTLSLAVDLEATDPTAVILPGTTWFFQVLYNDPNGGLVGFNLSDGYMIAFVP